MRIIKDIWNKCKTDWFLGLVFALGLLLAFGLGRLAAFEASRTPVTITYPNPSDPNIESNYSTLTNSDITGDIVASKQGSKYHLSSCPGAKQIKAENRVVFPSAAAARAAGYEPAANCPGLK
ncbi:MAG: hypothetical protein A2114_00680 [Candidatus Vogelbacteria bacterium GWA1_51_14]|uniref:Ada DNA repair metal-binding domain-containing protein n=1 Tax=Candidatus Vogelbacteria bacterium GWA1_51_14 TaxID=1802435 RepID=A0A1G2QA38_9BACT|nr:MAG: hypothetical protein A2114_00680 [Candidatus Vogelbacteria bacterium GWA1_51_14]